MGSFRRLLSYIGRYKKFIGLNIVSNILTALFTVVSIPLLQPFFEILFNQTGGVTDPPAGGFSAVNIQAWFKYRYTLLIDTEGKEKALLLVCGAILLAFFFKNLFRYLALVFMAPVRNGVVRDIRQQLFDKMLVLPLPYFSEERKGDLMSRMTGDVQEVEMSILNVLEALFREPLVIAGSLAYMLYQSPSLTLFVFLLIIFTGVVIGGIGRSLKRSSALVQEKLGNLVTIVDEALGGLRIIKGFNAEAYQHAKFGAENNAYRHILTRLLWRRDLSSPLSEFLGIAVVAVLLWYGSSLVFSGKMEPDAFITFIYAFYNVIDPSKQLSKAWYSVQKGIGALHRVEQVLDAETTILEKPDAKPIRSFEREIAFKDVSFAYNKEEGHVLKQIQLNIPKGKAVALVGASGAGKSTMADLLPRFYDVEEGGVFVDGLNIKDYKIKDLRSLMGIVSQEAVLFNDTIYNNIVFGLQGVAMEDVVNAARIANAHEFIMATEKGYETNIGDRGSKLSGGQRQRLTIARAILKNPPILILDEATSALDSESEKLVQAALLELMKNRTSLVIAHRLSTIQHADEIVVMRQGRIIERGNHHALLALNGEYKKLVELQAM